MIYLLVLRMYFEHCNGLISIISLYDQQILLSLSLLAKILVKLPMLSLDEMIYNSFKDFIISSIFRYVKIFSHVFMKMIFMIFLFILFFD